MKKLVSSLNVRRFGAKGNGKADDTKAIQNALDKWLIRKAGALCRWSRRRRKAWLDVGLSTSRRCWASEANTP